jgi:hypothetical protein
MQVASRFLKIIAPEGNITFQTFDDNKERKNSKLCKILHGNIDENLASLARLNTSGAGVFFMVNRGDGKGRKSENVTNVRAIFVDLDDYGSTGLAKVQEFSRPPRVIVESSPGKFHTYWLIDRDLPHQYFPPIQKYFAHKFGGDPAVCDLPRVMRLPGFFHRKGEPFMSRIMEDNAGVAPLPASILIQLAEKVTGKEPQSLATGAGTTAFAGVNDEFRVPAALQGLTPRLLSALATIDATSYDTWRNKVGVALHYETGGSKEGLQAWIDWSRTAPDKFEEGTCEREWASFDNSKEEGDRVTAGSIFHLAKEAGWIWTGGQQSDPEDETTIQRLAALSPLEYDRQRKEEADRLGVRTGTLDKMVQAARGGDEIEQGLVFDDLEPWPYLVDGATLLTEIAETIRRFIVCTPEVAQATALWAAMTWLMDTVQVAPLAVITAPEKRCGKSQLLFLLGKLVYRPLTASNISAAALFRTIERWRPTMLIDEADAFMRENEDMRGLLNSGHTREGAYVIRVTGDEHEPTRFSTWGAKALAGIGKMADTLMDRAILLELRRKLPHESVDRLRHAAPDLFSTLAEKLCRWVGDHREDVRKARPVLPGQLNDRAQDNWEPLLAIADVAGGPWPDMARAAAVKLASIEADQSIGVELLSDIREIFSARNVDRISTGELIIRLCEDKEKRWSTYNHGMEMSARQLANRLTQYGIKSKSVRISASTPKGYKLSCFAEAFERYLVCAP